MKLFPFQPHCEGFEPNSNLIPCHCGMKSCWYTVFGVNFIHLAPGISACVEDLKHFP